MSARAIFAACLVMLFSLTGRGEAATMGCLGGACHQGLIKPKYLHGPVAAELAGAKACVMCHLPAGAACTTTGKGIFKLKGKDICQACHTKGTGTQHSQSEIESKCLKCHAPHGSDSSRQFLRGDKAVILKKK